MRFYILSALGLASVVAANAGSIEIGGASGLSSNYITQGAGAVCNAGAGDCVTGSSVSWNEKNYDTILFQGATNSSSQTPTPFNRLEVNGWSRD
jgi:hypothetical protein